MENITKTTITDGGHVFRKSHSIDLVQPVEISPSLNIVQRTVSHPICIPGRKSSPIALDRERVKRESKEPISHQACVDADTDTFFTNMNVDKKIVTNSVHIQSRRSSQPVISETENRKDIRLDRRESTPLLINKTVNNNRRVSSPVQILSSPTQLIDNTMSKLALNDNYTKSKLVSGRRNSAFTRRSSFNNRMFSDISSESSLCIKKGSNISTNNSSTNSEANLNKTIITSQSSSRKGSGSASPVIAKKISQYQTALLESWNRKSSGNIAKDILQRQESVGSNRSRKESSDSDGSRRESLGSNGSRRESSESNESRRESLGSNASRRESSESNASRKDSLESNESLGINSIEESTNLDHESPKLQRSSRRTAVIASKKKSIIAKFEKLSSETRVKRRKSTPINRKKSLSNFTYPLDKETDKTLKLNEKEKIMTKRRFSVGHSINELQNIDSELSETTKTTTKRRFSVGHSINMLQDIDSELSETTKTTPKRRFSVGHSVNTLFPKLIENTTITPNRRFSVGQSIMLQQKNKSPDITNVMKSDELLSQGKDKISIKSSEQKPPKKDSGNYDDETLFSGQLSSSENIEKDYFDDCYNSSDAVTNIQLTNDNTSNEIISSLSITASSDAVSNQLVASEKPASDSNSDTDQSYNSNDSSISDSSYDTSRKVSVIERPLSIADVKKLTQLKSYNTMLPSSPRKIDEESGIFVDLENGSLPLKFETEHSQSVLRKQNAHANDKNQQVESRKSSDIDDSNYFPELNSLHHIHKESLQIPNFNSNVKSLSDLEYGELIGITDRTYSFNSEDSSPPDPSPSRTVSFNEENMPKEKPRRKFGTASIVSLDELPKRRMSRVVDWFNMNEREEDDMANSYESYYIPEGVSRKMSMYGQFLTFDDIEADEMEVVADKVTRDIIAESHGTLSSCSELAPYRPKTDIGSQRSFDKLRIDEETQSDEDNRSRSSTFSDNYSVSADESSSDESTHTVQDCTAGNDVKENVGNDAGNEDDDGATEIGEDVLEDEEECDGKRKNSSSFEIDGVIFERKTHPDERRSTTFSTMFGYFNFCLYNFISKEYSLEKWKEIVASLGLTRKQIYMFEKPKHSMFDDSITDQVIKTAAKTLNINFNLFLQKFGNSYFEWCCSKYGDLLKSIATNLADFINNMDDIRRHIHKIEKIADDYPPSIYALLDRQGTLLMYYHSYRDQKYLEYFLIGFIKSVAWVLYGLRSRVSLQQQRKNCEDFSVISIKAINSLVKKPSVSKLQISSRCKDLVIEPYLMDSMFPFHMIINEKLEICQLGKSLNRLLESYIPERGLSVHSYFKVEKPVIEDFNYSAILNNLNTAFILCSHKGLFKETFVNGLVLKGQMSFLESSKCLWFIGSPKVDFINQLNGDSNLYLSDIPLHDATREVLLVSEQTHEQDTLKSQLQILTNRLKETSKELALGKINTENILDEIFPKDVAERLMRDLPVPAVTAEEVSILFTDIVGFTAICGQCDPEDVTVMLNNLYLEFDFLCEKFDLYKVETIGDAYMVVGGLHRKENDHGRYITAMGVDMIAHAKNIKTPAGDDIKIRVGIHSGSVVAGVVGTRMPRYCLFGNNVAFANKMESTSDTCKVHISPATYLEIKHHQEFIFFERPRDIMPPLMQKLYQKGHTYFVTQRRPSTYEIPGTDSEKRLKYMKPLSQQDIIQPVRKPHSRKTSHSESVMSDFDKYPEELRRQLESLERINGYQSGKLLALPDMG